MSEPFVPIVGVIPFSTTDYPNKLAAVFFTQGCPFHCPYCHNGSIAWGHTLPKNEEFLYDFLEAHKHFLDGVVISGGEPTQHKGLAPFLKTCKGMGYQTALHTNGYYPEALQELIAASLVDYIAMDIKTLFENYKSLTGVSDSVEKVAKSVKLIINSGVKYEFRTTYHPVLLPIKELNTLMEYLHDQGATTYYIQRFQPVGVTDTFLIGKGQSVEVPYLSCVYGKKLFKTFGIR